MNPFFTLVALVWVLLIAGAPALAHSVLVASDPAAGAFIERAPQAVTLTFDEGVESELGSIRVLDAAGNVRSDGPVVHPGGDARRASVHVSALERGRYVVAWKVVSADSHLVNGAFAFGIGVPAGAVPVVAGDNGAALLLPILHVILLAGVLLGIGLPIGVTAIARTARRAPLGIEFGAWFIVAFGAFADVAFRADLAGGSLGAAFSTHTGMLRIITIVAAAAGIIALTGKQRRWPLLAVACVATALSLSLAGHAADGRFAVAGVAADTFHLFAAATWIGVLAIGTTLEAGPELRAISPIAMTAVAALIVTGVIQTFRNVGSFSALFGTAYGLMIDIKIVLLIALLAFAFSARRVLARGIFTIGTRIKTELWLLTAVVAITAVLVESPLPREAPPLATASATLTVRTIGVRVSAMDRGSRTWFFRVAATAPIDAADVSVSEQRRNVGPLGVDMQRTDARTFTGTAALPFAGKWNAYVSIRSGSFDEAHRTIALPETTP